MNYNGKDNILSNFNFIPQQKLKLEEDLQKSGWTRDQIIHQINKDTYFDLLSRGYQPSKRLCEEIIDVEFESIEPDKKLIKLVKQHLTECYGEPEYED